MVFKLSIKSEGKRKSKSGEVETTLVQAPMPMVQQMPGMAMPVQASAPAPQAAAPAAPAVAEAENNYITIKSPMIGTFYRSSSPDKDAYLNIGDSVKPGKVICIVEAMKLFNEIEAEVSGTVVKVLIDDATPVEYDQPLFLIDPS